MTIEQGALKSNLFSPHSLENAVHEFHTTKLQTQKPANSLSCHLSSANRLGMKMFSEIMPKVEHTAEWTKSESKQETEAIYHLLIKDEGI